MMSPMNGNLSCVEELEVTMAGRVVFTDAGRVSEVESEEVSSEEVEEGVSGELAPGKVADDVERMGTGRAVLPADDGVDAKSSPASDDGAFVLVVTDVVTKVVGIWGPLLVNLVSVPSGGVVTLVPLLGAGFADETP